MKKKYTDLDHDSVVSDYRDLKSLHKVAKKHECSSDTISKILKLKGEYRNSSQAAKERSESWRLKIVESAKKRTGDKNPFFGKKHTIDTKSKLSDSAKERVGKRNPNYRHGEYKRRPKDYLISDFQKVRAEVFIKEDYTCSFCKNRGGNLHAHHRIPYWVCKEAYLDIDNLVTCCETCHLQEAHNGDYAKFNISIISDDLILKYNLDRERLNELADFNNKKSDAKV